MPWVWPKKPLVALSVPCSEEAMSQWWQRGCVLLLVAPHVTWPGPGSGVRSRPEADLHPHLPLVLAAAFSGPPQAVIMTSGPLKREGMLASTVSQSNMVITPAAITRVRGPDRPSASFQPQGAIAQHDYGRGVTSISCVPVGSWSHRVP